MKASLIHFNQPLSLKPTIVWSTLRMVQTPL
jgi:hypothetical protein